MRHVVNSHNALKASNTHHFSKSVLFWHSKVNTTQACSPLDVDKRVVAAAEVGPLPKVVQAQELVLPLGEAWLMHRQLLGRVSAGQALGVDDGFISDRQRQKYQDVLTLLTSAGFHRASDQKLKPFQKVREM